MRNVSREGISYFTLLFCSAFAGSLAGASSPSTKWVFEAQGTLYAAPVVADIHPSPGLETLISDAEARKLRCISSKGVELWSCNPGWTKRLTSSAAVSFTARPGKATLIIGGSDGLLCCLDGETSQILWQEQKEAMGWGGAIWADLNGDKQDEAVVTTESSVEALTSDGQPLWPPFKGPENAPLQIGCLAAACDANKDQAEEIFVASDMKVFSLSGKDGAILWDKEGPFMGLPPILADRDNDGRPELYCGCENPPAVTGLDATSGQPLGHFSLSSPPVSLSSGDLDGDGMEELVVSDEEGTVSLWAKTSSVDPEWRFSTTRRASSFVSLGDVDGDSDIEVLFTSEDHGLYALSPQGSLEWRWEADRRLLSPPSLSEIDQDGQTEILFGGSDHQLRCITLKGRQNPSLMAWPCERFSSRGSGSAFPRPIQAPLRSIERERSLLENGGFERLAGENSKGISSWRVCVSRPGQRPEPPVVQHCRTGQRSGYTSGGFRLQSTPVLIPAWTKALSIEAYAKGSGKASARIRWMRNGRTLGEDVLKPSGEESGWRLLKIESLSVPREATEFDLSLEGSKKQNLWWDDVKAVALVTEIPHCQVLVNQVGYDLGAPKRFTVQCNFEAEQTQFEVKTPEGEVQHSGTLEPMGRIKGFYGPDWGYAYWRGDFSGLDRPGRYRIDVFFPGCQSSSWPFEVGEDLLWHRTAELAYKFFTTQRCGAEVPGHHKACHLDDGISLNGVYYNLSGGWHDAGDYNTYHNAPYVFGLAQAYEIQKPLFDRMDEDQNQRSDFLDEILWGGDQSRRMISPDGSAFGRITSGYGFWGPPELETDNLPQTGDERPLDPPGNGCSPAVHAAAMAKIARYVEDKSPWIEAAVRALDWARSHGEKNVHLFSAALDLSQATGDEAYAQWATTQFPEIVADETVIHAVLEYDKLMKEDHGPEIRRVLIQKADDMLRRSKNPFGILTFGDPEHPNFFNTPAEGDGWRVGTNSALCQAASLMALAYSYEKAPQYLAFIYDQLNWILGNNPFDVSLMEGAGSSFPPTYHHRILFAGVDRGAIPGSVINGICWLKAGEDVPYLDMSGVDIPYYSSNECWLPHNTNYLNALSNLQRSRD